MFRQNNTATYSLQISPKKSYKMSAVNRWCYSISCGRHVMALNKQAHQLINLNHISLFIQQSLEGQCRQRCRPFDNIKTNKGKRAADALAPS